MSKDQIIVHTNANGVRTVKVIDILRSEKGKEGLAKSRELFYRMATRTGG